MPEISFLRGVPAEEALDAVKETVAAGYQDALEHYGARVLQYSTPGTADFNGFVPLKETLGARYGVEGSAANRVICFNGGMEVFSLLLKSFPRGSRVAMEALTYDRALSDALRYEHKVVGIPFAADGVDLNALEEELAAGETKLFYRIIYHQNPTGLDSTLANIETAAELCARHGVLYVCDIAYYELRYDGQPNLLPGLAKYPNTCLIGSFTKTLSPGTKCGFGIFPEGIVEQLTPVIANTRLNPNYPTQAMVHEVMSSGKYDDYLAYLNQLYRPRMDILNESLAQHLPDVEVPHLTGGFFAGIWLAGIDDETGFISAVEANGCKIASANVFAPGFAEKCRSEKNGPFFRLTFPALKPEAIQEGVEIIARIYAEQRK